MKLLVSEELSFFSSVQPRLFALVNLCCDELLDYQIVRLEDSTETAPGVLSKNRASSVRITRLATCHAYQFTLSTPKQALKNAHGARQHTTSSYTPQQSK